MHDSFNNSFTLNIFFFIFHLDFRNNFLIPVISNRVNIDQTVRILTSSLFFLRQTLSNINVNLNKRNRLVNKIRIARNHQMVAIFIKSLLVTLRSQEIKNFILRRSSNLVITKNNSNVFQRTLVNQFNNNTLGKLTNLSIKDCS